MVLGFPGLGKYYYCKKAKNLFIKITCFGLVFSLITVLKLKTTVLMNYKC